MDVQVEPLAQNASGIDVALRTGIAFRRKSVHNYPVEDVNGISVSVSIPGACGDADGRGKASSVIDCPRNGSGISNIDSGVSDLNVSVERQSSNNVQALHLRSDKHNCENDRRDFATDVGHEVEVNGCKHVQADTQCADDNMENDGFLLKELGALSDKIPGSEEYSKLFLAKIEQCKVIFDFRNEDSHKEGKAIKHDVLIELSSALQETHSKGIDIVSDELVSVAVEMVGLNLFRDFSPPVEPGAPEFDLEEDVPVWTHDWPHVELVYKFFTTLIECCTTKTVDISRHFPRSFIFQLLMLFDTYDARERDMLKTALHRLYAKVIPHRAYIRSSISNTFYRHIYLNGGKHNGVSELLEIMGSVINGFSLPIKLEHKNFLEKVLIPLHSPKSIGEYHRHLVYCVLQFANKDSSLIVPIVHGLLRYWPKSNTTKENLFLNELEELVDSEAAAKHFGDICGALVRRINLCLQSFHFQVAERAIYFFNNKAVVRRMLEHSSTAIPMVMDTLAGSLNSHWSPGMKALTQNCLRNLRLQYETYKEDTFGDSLGNANRKRKAGGNVSNTEARAEKWRRVEELAQRSIEARNGNHGPALTHITTGIPYQNDGNDI
eukprot:m.35684 g.35684  ORF g.35684 m.35684 type:complete len:606 (-) comp14429_c0_seq1:292-2109(-)